MDRYTKETCSEKIKRYQKQINRLIFEQVILARRGKLQLKNYLVIDAFPEQIEHHQMRLERLIFRKELLFQIYETEQYIKTKDRKTIYVKNLIKKVKSLKMLLREHCLIYNKD